MEGIWKWKTIAVIQQKQVKTLANNFHNHVIVLEAQLKEEHSNNEEFKKTIEEIEKSQAIIAVQLLEATQLQTQLAHLK